MKSLRILVIHFFIPGVMGAQIHPSDSLHQPTEISEIKPDEAVNEVRAAFPGGDNAFAAFISRNIVYPEKELEEGTEGVVYVTFVIDTLGQITNVHSVKGINGGPGLSAEAIRVISSSPRWTPATMNGKKTNMEFTVPVRFAVIDTRAERKTRREKKKNH